jgi:hypothetical protein
MKKNLIILGLLIGSLSVMAFKFLNSDKVTSCNQNITPIKSTLKLGDDFFNLSNILNPKDILYKVESRFLSTISKSDLNNAKTIADLVPKKATESIESYHYSRVSLLDDHIETDRRAYAENEVLTPAQINLLQSVGDSDNIYVRSDFIEKDAFSGTLQNKHLTYFVSVVPDQQAEYQEGHNSLIEYLKKNSEEEIKVITKDGLRAGKVQFTVTKDGMIDKVKLTSTSGYSSVDERLVEIIENIPGSWTPGSNKKGENVDQEFVFFFGLMGC